jgi:hypothetical protein
VTTTIWVLELLEIVAADPAKVTDDAPPRSVPEMVTVVPPATEPEAGLTELIDGAGAV